jgi:colicin import membrane protein
MKSLYNHTGGSSQGPSRNTKETHSQFNLLLFGVSLIFHVILFSVFFLIQTLAPPQSVELPMVKVNLVSLGDLDLVGGLDLVEDPSPEVPVDSPDEALETSLPDGASAETVPPEPPEAIAPVESNESPQSTPAVSPPESVVDAPVKIPLVEKKIVLKKIVLKKKAPPPPKPVPLKPVVPRKKVSLKKKTYRPEKVLASAKKQIAQSVKKQEENSLDTALKRLRKKVAAQGSKRGGMFGADGAKGTGNGKKTRAIDLYNLELMYRIQQNWAFNRQLAGGNDTTEVRILIKILKSGHIRDVWFETRSGNRLLDESALKAVKKSNPLSPLPGGYNSYDVGLIFTPSGLM